jgi:hypothetical protein
MSSATTPMRIMPRAFMRSPFVPSFVGAVAVSFRRGYVAGMVAMAESMGRKSRLDAPS